MKRVLEFITLKSRDRHFIVLMVGEAEGYEQIIFTEASRTSSLIHGC